MKSLHAPNLKVLNLTGCGVSSLKRNFLTQKFYAKIGEESFAMTIQRIENEPRVHFANFLGLATPPGPTL